MNGEIIIWAEWVNYELNGEIIKWMKGDLIQREMTLRKPASLKHKAILKGVVEIIYMAVTPFEGPIDERDCDPIINTIIITYY